jgi:hypothetical protein
MSPVFKVEEKAKRWTSMKLLSKPFFFFGLFSDPEDEGDMLFRNVGWLLADYMAYRRAAHNHRCENLKSYTTFSYFLRFCLINF